MNIGEIINVKCEYIASDGKGVMKNPDFVIYVPYLLTGEEAKVCVMKIKNRNIYGDIVEIITKSEDRVKVKCPQYRTCGSCQLLHMSYDREIKLKEGLLTFLFKRSGISISRMNNPLNYRKKTVMSFGVKKQKMIAGLYEEGTHKIVEVNNCLIQSEKANEINNAILDVMKKHKIKPFFNNQGTMRHVLIRVGTDGVMVVLVVGNDMFHGRNNFVKDLNSRELGITTIVQNFNDRDTSVVLGDKERILSGKGYVYDYICGKKFKISSKSFFQVNPVQAEILFTTAIKMADLNKKDIVMDAYCGTGAIAIILASQVKKVIGVEENKNAIKDAISNKRENGAHNVEFYAVNVEKFMTSYDGNIDVVFLDPPREGCSEEFIESLMKLNPKKIIYISCNPITQVRDVKKLINYELANIEGIDMFPRTMHIETVISLVRIDQ